MPGTNSCSLCGALLEEGTAGPVCAQCLHTRELEVTVAGPVAGVATAAGTAIRYFGDYEIQHEIARGGMGVVYRARQMTLNRPVAVKMLLAGTLADDAAIARFHTEAEAAANLRHPNIVAIHEIGVHEGHHYFSMDYIEGRSLADVIGGAPVAPIAAATYVKTMAEAIHFAHQRGTLHRDLKPSNVLVDVDGQPHITDFGLARIADRDHKITVTGAVLGTANYMSPEQAAGRHDEVGPASDVYSLGAILYELLTGQPPFQAGSVQATLVKVATEDPRAPRALNASIPSDLQTICLKCLEKSPVLRYASARELAEDVERFLKDEPIVARSSGRIRRARQWLKRHPLILAGILAILLLAMVAVAYGLWQQTQYLVWLSAHPGYERVAGPRIAYLERVRDVTGWLRNLLMLVLLVSLFKLRHLTNKSTTTSQILAWKRYLPVETAVVRDGASRKKSPISPWVLRLFEALAIVVLVAGFFQLKIMIDAWVWEGYGKFSGWTDPPFATYWSVYILLIVRRFRHPERRHFVP